MTRPTWDAYFLDIAATVATRSPCVKRKVGAVLVSQDRAILATGYNGPPRGAPHRNETTCVRIGIPSGERADVVCCAHAEINAIAQAARHGVPVKGATLYVTTSPCAWCARSIVNAGVVCVVRSGDYNDPVAANVFAESNIPVRGPGNDPPFTGEQLKQSFARADRLRDERDGHVFEKGIDVPRDARDGHMAARPILNDTAEHTASRIRNLEGIRELSFQQIQALEAEVARLNASCAGWGAQTAARYLRLDADAETRIAAAITDVLDGPLASEPPELGSEALNAVAKRIIAVRTELDAVHADLGALTQLGEEVGQAVERADAWKATADHISKLSDEIQTLQNDRDAWAAKANTSRVEADELSGRLTEIIEAVGKLAHELGIAWADADTPTALDVLAQVSLGFMRIDVSDEDNRAEALEAECSGLRLRAAKAEEAHAKARENLGSFVANVDVALGGPGTRAPEVVVREVARNAESEAQLALELGALVQERDALIAWVDGKGSLGGGPIAKAVLRYAKEHEDRVWEAAEKKHAADIERVKAEGEAIAKAVDDALGVVASSHEVRLQYLADPKGSIGDFVSWARNDALNDARRQLAADAAVTDFRVKKLTAIHAAALVAMATPGLRRSALTDIAKMADEAIQGRPTVIGL